ncbi:cytochrome P450 CYP72A219-like [Prunus yedoensis var. nudiflora]|uniref:Cytochrome P450 CYP72A219-like n=1 Tax=Prunus yedoensis var. nudiflora TaxID=2094558 RepID=A0A314ZPC7_PRUYE|nr:cytochrome P450 CYP72A219-like [Prunus yedoensis var. nudiflora]
MEVSVVASVALRVFWVSIVITWAWRVLNWVWLRPKRLERCLRQQGLAGNSYRLLVGDTKESSMMVKEAKSKPMNLSQDITPRVLPFLHQSVTTYGMPNFQKPVINPLVKLLATGLPNYEGEKWAKHRKIINPGFHLEKLKRMLPAFHQSCSEMIEEWETLVSKEGSCELDVWPYLESLAADVISRASFGSSYQEGRKIFQLLKEQAKLTIRALQSVYIPGWRFLPTRSNKRMKEIDREIKGSLRDIISTREEAIRMGEATKDDLLECKLFYFAGQETTSVLLLWTLVLLSQNQNWQARARDEVLQVFGSNKPDFDGLSHLKVVTMILLEVLRLYPSVVALPRTTHNKTQLGKLSLPAGVEVSLPILLLHHDKELWGEDAIEFNPERFSEGVSKASKNQFAYFPFGGGPRICIGQNFAMLEAKLAFSLLLQRFTFELSPSYAHAPSLTISLQPQYGAHIILHKR